MISNFHQSSGPDEKSSYYTFGEPSHASKTNNSNNGKKKKNKGRRIFGLGKPNKKKSAEMGDWRPPHMMDDNSTMTGGQSLSYSTSAASYQTSGESTDSSGGAFGDILKLLDEEDAKEIKEKLKSRLYPSDRSIYSTASSLAYSEGGTTFNYSEDGDHSYLEGTKLFGMLAEPSDSRMIPQPAGGAREEVEREEPYLLTPPAASKTPVMNNKSTSHRPTKNSRRARLRREREEIEELDDNLVSSSSSSQSYSSRWFCGMDFGEAGTVLRPFLCF